MVEGRKCILMGVDIPYKKGLLGHSDADVAIHALMDAMLGAAAMGDIGRLFPDNDPAYEGISSVKLLEEVRDRIYAAGFTVSNLDVTIICQKPKVSPYIEEMTEVISKTLAVDKDRINIKGTTTEKLGFTGRGEGIAALAVCTLAR
ncbi:MAG: 2-C-methyl-D-erythritol 2,4-cyclodiphosphate synthase [Spirochaetales bacterium]|nr:2-C-methyl-D-erythritol 2,4-cyclodiphosphate synthase [Spirochaetales bacterium]